MNQPSFMSYDLREDDLISPVQHFTMDVLSLLLTGVLVVTLLHFLVEPNILPKAEASEIVDDAVLCSNPLTSPVEVGEYCYQLMTRGL